ncbi:MAG: ABC transporter substrate-binding protein [Alysiella sp.]|uniref:ABC transporter substrate-binding protein n=1 Tax=Alysiella sp. TaxID=1872483 RepID=UPI0026DA71A4|nr:ABC transporter substrate-binding protein [Alysiella sp.]MDO4434505.1 ABC transporter substrate-binding protein [Alysiella sp.]
MKHTKLFTLSALATSLLLAACGGGNNTQSAAPASDETAKTAPASSSGSKTLVYCSEGSPSGFDPAQWTDGTSFDASAYPIYNGLVQFPRNGTEIQPALAEKWDISEDNKTYTFHLRKGVKFHSNESFTPSREFNADDVVFTFKRLSDPNFAFNKAYPTEFPYAVDMGLPDNIANVEKVDDYTVKITLKEVDAPFLQNIAMPFAYIGSAEYADKLEKAGKAADYNTQPIGTGPFKFVSYNKDSQIRYAKHADYWNVNDVHIDNLVFAITKDSAVRAQKVAAGECHVSAYPKTAEVEAAKKAGKINIIEQSGFNLGYVGYNVEKAPFKDLKVRQALDMAINRDAIINAVYQGAGTAATNPMPPTQWSYNDTLKNAPYDVEKAKSLLAEAGIKEGTEIELWAMPVQRPYNPNAKLMSEMIQADWAKIGLKTKIVSYEWGEYLKRLKNGEGGAFLMGWTGDNGDPDNWLGNLLTCKAKGSNYARFCHAEFDKLVNDARVLTDKAQREDKYKQAQVIFKEQLPWTTMAHSVVTVFTAKNVQGFEISPFGNMRFDGVKVE